jgi:hypothetical protein
MALMCGAAQAAAASGGYHPSWRVPGGIDGFRAPAREQGAGPEQGMDKEPRHKPADTAATDRSEVQTARLLLLAVVVAVMWIVVAALWSARLIGLI